VASKREKEFGNVKNFPQESWKGKRSGEREFENDERGSDGAKGKRVFIGVSDPSKKHLSYIKKGKRDFRVSSMKGSSLLGQGVVIYVCQGRGQGKKMDKRVVIGGTKKSQIRGTMGSIHSGI